MYGVAQDKRCLGECQSISIGLFLFQLRVCPLVRDLFLEILFLVISEIYFSAFEIFFMVSEFQFIQYEPGFILYFP